MSGCRKRPPLQETAHNSCMVSQFGLARRTWLLSSAAIIALACLVASGARAQDIEPRKWSDTPVGVNFLILGYAYTQGGIAFDPSLPINNPHLETNSGGLGFARSLDLWGFSGKFERLGAVHVAVGLCGLPGTAGAAYCQRIRQSGVRVVRQSIGCAGNRDEGFRRLQAGLDRRRSVQGVGAVRAIR